MSDAARRIDPLLEPHRDALGSAFGPYRGHACRVYHYTLVLRRDARPGDEAKVAIASAFHDLGIWVVGTMDYLDPSVALALAELDGLGRPEWGTDVRAMVKQHHKLTG